MDVLVPGLTISKTPSTPAPRCRGRWSGYTVTVTDSGQTPYAGAAVTDSLAEMADDAVYDGDAAASAGSVQLRGPGADVDGDLSPGATATVTYSVTVDNPDTGDKLLIITATSAAAGSSCPPGTTSSPCQVTVPVLTPGADDRQDRQRRAPRCRGRW